MSAGVPLPPQHDVDSNALPTPSQISEASALEVYDEHGVKVRFGHILCVPTSTTLSTGPGSESPSSSLQSQHAQEAEAKLNSGGEGKTRRVAVVFIRHFFCGACQSYVRNLAMVPEEKIEAEGAEVVVVGCGEWEVIKGYRGASKPLLLCTLGKLIGCVQRIRASKDRCTQTLRERCIMHWE